MAYLQRAKKSQTFLHAEMGCRPSKRKRRKAPKRGADRRQWFDSRQLRGAGAAIALVVGAVEILDLRIALIEVEVKVAAAIGADQQAGKHIVFSVVGAALADFAPLLLHLLIHSTLDDRLMDVLEHHPILTVIVDPLLILVGLGICVALFLCGFGKQLLLR